MLLRSTTITEGTDAALGIAAEIFLRPLSKKLQRKARPERNAH